ncbi:hypothetical protein GUITHDRAFT_122360 [Guillardia theta CCMP2712]|uniref:Uncharacterized protein n=1 Tax=Guillardia theta (strain CCMP2712) TaxID=905079 RepID=L1I5U6_GUITC|nr:hypothetical protein GUITHDRAFT_122360 [Guillardia theta CCMP2712]EKX31452.1 hypothetical protein GUITHDRAFT_122360 [Guillardia theta CCMP2712]|eukprot:XP_005818432.1 hypothetical protein GUITHDRAFT_122360 [Guillardia theta CCMP2712]
MGAPRFLLLVPLVLLVSYKELTRSGSAVALLDEHELQNDMKHIAGVVVNSRGSRVPPAIAVPKPPITIRIGKRGAAGGSSKLSTGEGEPSEEKEGESQEEYSIPKKALEEIEELNRKNHQDLIVLTNALDSMKEEDAYTADSVGEQLGEFERKLEDLIRQNTRLRRQVWLLHKMPGLPGPQGVPGIDGRDGRSRHAVAPPHVQ